MSDKAYTRLRRLNADYGLGNNYLLTVLLENLDNISEPARLRKAFADFIAEYGAPQPRGANSPPAGPAKRPRSEKD